MKTFLVVCLLCSIVCEVFSNTVDYKPIVSTDVDNPVTFTTVSLQRPYCYFDSLASQCTEIRCNVYMVASLSSAKSDYDANQTTSALFSYTSAFTAGGKKYFTIPIDNLDNLPCPAAAPYNILVGADGACTTYFCNGVFPEGETVSFKYILMSTYGRFHADTKWSDNIPLKQRKSPDSLGSGYAGRSGATVAITTILSITVVVLFISLLTTLILVCQGNY